MSFVGIIRFLLHFCQLTQVITLSCVLSCVESDEYEHKWGCRFSFMGLFFFFEQNNGVVKARLVCVFKNWKLLFKNIYGNTCGWKSVLKYVKCCLKTENGCLKTQTKHPLRNSTPNSQIKWCMIWRGRNCQKWLRGPRNFWKNIAIYIQLLNILSLK